MIPSRPLARFLVNNCVRKLSYIQGQSPPGKPKVREYFYYIDHQGQLFMDDVKVKNFITCFKDKKFLAFFFKQLKKNTTDRYRDRFPYLSPCGIEHNFIHCDDRPIVYTHLLETTPESGETQYLSFGHAGDLLKVEFEPEKLCMLTHSGRVYYPASDKTGGIGLVKSSLAIEFSKHFEFGEAGEYAPPTHFVWKGKRYMLTNQLWDLLSESEKQF